MRVLADASLPCLTEAFPPPFQITLYDRPEAIPSLLAKQDTLLCRSTLKVNQALLQGQQLSFVATASSGRDHLDQAYLEKQQIQILDARGSNASSVADYVLACFAYLDKERLIQGSRVGIIGLGCVGQLVAQRLTHLGFEVFSYDPPKALSDPLFKSCDLEALYSCAVLCLHASLHDLPPYPSAQFISQVFLSRLKPGCVIMNAARGGLVDEEALIHSPIIYCTDVYCHEPDIDPRIVDKALICTPHIAGHNMEAKKAAVIQISSQLHHCLSLPLPKWDQESNIPPQQEGLPWQDWALAQYNPMKETEVLKQAQKKSLAFLRLRKEHQYRHDFGLIRFVHKD